MQRAVFDTNVYISALLIQGKPLALLKSAAGRDRKTDLYISVDIMKEMVRVLGSPKFLWPEARIKKAIAYINAIASVAEPAERIKIIREDDADNRILECALAANVDYIVSGDRHLLDLKKFGDIKILAPADFLELIEES